MVVHPHLVMMDLMISLQDTEQWKAINLALLRCMIREVQPLIRGGNNQLA